MNSDYDNDLALTCGSEIYTVRAPIHILCLILNILLPGTGTMLSAISCLHAVKEHKNMSCSCGTFADGLLQLLLGPLIFGWVWSIFFGIALYKKGRNWN